MSSQTAHPHLFAGDYVLGFEDFLEPMNSICERCWLDHPSGGCDRD